MFLRRKTKKQDPPAVFPTAQKGGLNRSKSNSSSLWGGSMQTEEVDEDDQVELEGRRARRRHDNSSTSHLSYSTTFDGDQDDHQLEVQLATRARRCPTFGSSRGANAARDSSTTTSVGSTSAAHLQSRPRLKRPTSISLDEDEEWSTSAFNASESAASIRTRLDSPMASSFESIKDSATWSPTRKVQKSNYATYPHQHNNENSPSSFSTASPRLLNKSSIQALRKARSFQDASHRSAIDEGRSATSSFVPSSDTPPKSTLRSMKSRASKFSLRSLASAMSYQSPSSSSTSAHTVSASTGANRTASTTSPSFSTSEAATLTSHERFDAQLPSPPITPELLSTPKSTKRTPSHLTSPSPSYLSPVPNSPPELLESPLTYSWSEQQPGAVRGKAARVLGEVTVPTGKAARLLGTETTPVSPAKPKHVKMDEDETSDRESKRLSGLEFLSENDPFIASTVYKPGGQKPLFAGKTANSKPPRTPMRSLAQPTPATPTSRPLLAPGPPRTLRRSVSENVIGRSRSQFEIAGSDNMKQAQNDVFIAGEIPLERASPAFLFQRPGQDSIQARRQSTDSNAESNYGIPSTYYPFEQSKAITTLTSFALPSIRSSGGALTLAPSSTRRSSSSGQASNSSWWIETASPSLASPYPSSPFNLESFPEPPSEPASPVSEVSLSAQLAKEVRRLSITASSHLPPATEPPSVPPPPVPANPYSPFSQLQEPQKGRPGTSSSAAPSEYRRSERGHALEALEGKRFYPSKNKSYPMMRTVAPRVTTASFSPSPPSRMKGESPRIIKEKKDDFDRRESAPFINWEESSDEDDEIALFAARRNISRGPSLFISESRSSLEAQNSCGVFLTSGALVDLDDSGPNTPTMGSFRSSRALAPMGMVRRDEGNIGHEHESGTDFDVDHEDITVRTPGAIRNQFRFGTPSHDEQDRHREKRSNESSRQPLKASDMGNLSSIELPFQTPRRSHTPSVPRRTAKSSYPWSVSSAQSSTWQSTRLSGISAGSRMSFGFSSSILDDDDNSSARMTQRSSGLSRQEFED